VNFTQYLIAAYVIGIGMIMLYAFYTMVRLFAASQRCPVKSRRERK